MMTLVDKRNQRKNVKRQGAAYLFPTSPSPVLQAQRPHHSLCFSIMEQLQASTWLEPLPVTAATPAFQDTRQWLSSQQGKASGCEDRWRGGQVDDRPLPIYYSGHPRARWVGGGLRPHPKARQDTCWGPSYLCPMFS